MFELLPVIYGIQLEKELLAYRPDLIFLAVDMTDMLDDFLYLMAAEYDSNSKVLAVPSNSEAARTLSRVAGGVRKRGVLEGILVYFSPWSVIAAKLSESIRVKAYYSDPDPEFPYIYDWTSRRPHMDISEYKLKTFEAVERIISLGQKHGVSYVVTLVPHLGHFKGELTSQLFVDFENLVSTNGATYIDSFNGLSLLGGDPDRLYQPGDIHFNSLGYSEWARIISKPLSKIIENYSRSLPDN